MFDHINQLYEKEKSLLIDVILEYHLRKESAKENSSKPSPSRISEEEHVGIHNSRRNGDFHHSNKESNGNSSDEE